MDCLVLTAPWLWLVAWMAAVKSVTAQDWCNTTLTGSDVTSSRKKVSFVVSDLRPLTSSGQSYYCWLHLQANSHQYVEVDVTKLNVGNYDISQRSCAKGHVRLSERTSLVDRGRHWMPAMTVCGSYGDDRIRVKRYTSGPSAFVEVKMDEVEETGNGVEFDAIFVDKAPEDTLPYGHVQRHDGKINNTDCDWLIPTDTCLGHCAIISPGYPGVYPSDARCRYSIVNFDDGRVQLSFGGQQGTFDLRESENCAEDYVDIYDGPTVKSPRIGRYCGRDEAVIISSGTTLLMDFHSGSGGPPWDYSGFQMDVIQTWKLWHENGRKSPDGPCDWAFHSSDAESGDFHTPDHLLEPGTSCRYELVGRDEESVRVEIRAYDFLPNCTEYIEVLRDSEVIDKLCESRIQNKLRGTQFSYSASGGSRLSLRYHTNGRRVSNPDTTWIRYHFFQPSRRVRGPTEQGPTDKESEGEEEGDGDDGKMEEHVEISGDSLENSESVREEEDSPFPYGSSPITDPQNEKEGCNQTIQVDTCYGICKLMSPGFPNPVRPGTSCQYTLKNFLGARVQMQFGSKYTSFDLLESPNCTVEYLRVYDGETKWSPLLGTYCGSEGDFIISSGSAIHVEFQGAPDSVERNSTIFEVKYTDRWKNEHEFGSLETGTACDWSFESRDSLNGYLNTPDHMVEDRTTCLYKFKGQPGQIVEVELKIQQLRPDCEEYLEVYDQSSLMNRICRDDLQHNGQDTHSFKFNSTGDVMTVKYHILERQISNSHSSWIHYNFYNIDGWQPSNDSGHVRANVMISSCLLVIITVILAQLVELTL